ncbi:MAG: UDP-glucose 4-epimerase [Pelagibacterales bacterium]|nr:UDP-glucose 4-epimerase [Pelagibacterales bacterium]
MKAILVTGGAGYIGSHIIELLLKKSFKVVIIDNLSTGYMSLVNKKAKFFKVNINKQKLVKSIITQHNIDSVIHLAAKLNVLESMKKPKIYYKNNITGTLSLLKACEDTKVKNFLFSSTCAIYSDKISHAKETSQKKPQSIYGITKLKCEKEIKKKFKDKKINYGILRYFNVAGASPSKKIGQINKNGQLFKNLSLAVKRKKPKINLYGNSYNTVDGTCERDFIHVSDLADLHIRTLIKINKERKSLILNCGYGKSFSVLRVIKEFEKISNKKIHINFKNKRKGDMKKVVANIDKLKKILKWSPKYSNLKKIIKSSIEWEKKL